MYLNLDLLYSVNKFLEFRYYLYTERDIKFIEFNFVFIFFNNAKENVILEWFL